ncbi:MAG: hypothetical protein KC910_11740 [Candidatus Eremiobacteraeota bacterium]|nr:hypothetical protein [Candidatus Eremiobacteraeota bacterium]
MAVIATAFLAIHRNSLGVLAASGQSLLAREASLSGINYARMRLESDSNWGVPSGANKSLQPVVGMGPFLVWEGEDNGTVQVVGVLDGGKACFQMHFQAPNSPVKAFDAYQPRDILAYPADPTKWSKFRVAKRRVSKNNLNSLSISPPLTGNLVGFRNLPSRTALIQVLSDAEGSRKYLDVTLRRSNFVDQAVAVEGSLGVRIDDASTDGRWDIVSNQASNKILANGAIFAPEVSSSNVQVQFLSPGGAGDKGQLRSGSYIGLGGLSRVDYNPNLADPSLRVIFDQTGTKIGDGVNDAAERNLVKSQSQGDFIPNSPKQRVPDVDPSRLTSSSRTYQLPSGRYHFVAPNKVNYYSDPHASLGSPPTRTFVDVIPDSFHLGGTGAAAIRLSNRVFRVDGDSEVQFNGEVNITSNRQGVPYVGLGYDSLGLSGKAGGIKVAGDFSVDGAVVGTGAVVATAGDGDGRVTIQGKSAIAAPQDAGVTLYAEGDVVMKPVSGLLPTSAGPSVLDFEVFQSGLDSYNFNMAGNHSLNAWAGLSPDWRRKHVVDGTGISGGGKPILDRNVGNGVFHDALDDLRSELVGSPGVTAADIGQFDQFVDGVPDPMGSTGSPTTSGMPTTGGGGPTWLIPPADNNVRNYLAARQYALDVVALRQNEPPGTPNPFDPASYSQETLGNGAYTVLDVMADGAKQVNKYLSGFMHSGGNPFRDGSAIPATPRDVDFRGLVYTNGNFFADLDGYRMTVNGSLVAHNNVGLKDAKSVLSIYNPELLDQLMKYQATSNAVPLEVTSWTEQ